LFQLRPSRFFFAAKVTARSIAEDRNRLTWQFSFLGKLRLRSLGLGYNAHADMQATKKYIPAR